MQRIATPGVEINKIFRLPRDAAMKATAGRQEPYTSGSLPGKEDFFSAAGKSVNSPVAPKETNACAGHVPGGGNGGILGKVGKPGCIRCHGGAEAT